ncbi:DNA methylase [Croceicoccus ponticola]|uniref:Methyltransferase n=1 Tax=Croceicoccus ponticola TaxID=2217664 RepID=A0A437H1X3_9SPHN|nr:DNA methyltransferase [Croceicoccus ponticola]RVQ69635.1 DNA methylase [Croceicoccus ponticola]
MARGDRRLPDRLKGQLQRKSTERRSRNTKATQLEAVKYRHGRNDLQPDMRTVMRPIAALKPAPHRTRKTAPEQVHAVMRSVQEFGIVLPILIDGNDAIVAGNVLWEAAKQLGIETIECRVVDHLEPIELEALSLALNRLGETGTWDLDILRERMIEIRSAGIELLSTGFTVPLIDQIIINPDPVEPSEEGDEEAETDDAPPVTQLGDLYHLGEHRLLCGDALDESSYRNVLNGREAQAVFSDPPYNCKIEGFVSGLGKHKHLNFQMAVGEMEDGEFFTFLTTYLGHCRTVTSEGAIIFACMDFRQIDLLLMAGRNVGLTRNNVAIWTKGSGGMTGSIYRSQYENIAVFCNGKKPATNNVELGRHGRDRTNSWSYPGANRKGSSAASALADHPTPKPVELVEDALLDVTNPGDLVLDPFMGSGTTMIAAERSGRLACGIELDPIYVDRSIRRWEAVTGKDAIHVQSGMTFAELAEARLIDLHEDEELRPE